MPPTCLSESDLPLVIDTSVAINLTASGFAAHILRALAKRILVVDTVLGELEDGRERGRRDADLFGELLAKGLVEKVSLGTAGEDVFQGLVAGCAVETLDDGESSTIAYAVEQGIIALIDEGKANALCARRFPTLTIYNTVDLYSHPSVMSSLGIGTLASAVFNSLQLARMNVRPQHLDWVIGLIGLERAALCTSLPRAVRLRRSSGD